MPTLTGHFSVFNQWTEIRSVYEGHFMERFAPGAFDKTISESRDQMRVLFNHGSDPQIGNKVLGTIRSLNADEYGVRYEVPLLDTSYNRDLIPGLEGGPVRRVVPVPGDARGLQHEAEARSDYNPDGLPERTVTESKRQGVRAGHVPRLRGRDRRPAVTDRRVSFRTVHRRPGQAPGTHRGRHHENKNFSRAGAFRGHHS
jgi:HK97 family phage prohead protease